MRMRFFSLLCTLLVGVAGCDSSATTPPASHHTTSPLVAQSAASSETGFNTGTGFKTGAQDMPERVVHSDRQWKELLTPEQFYVLRQKGTEQPFTNQFDDHFSPGVYSCAACGQALFSSEAKFHSGCGWPAFYAAQAGDRVVLTVDRSHGMVRTEVTCARCDSHLGHIFDDAPDTPTGKRYCINSVSLTFTPAPARDGTSAQGEKME